MTEHLSDGEKFKRDFALAYNADEPDGGLETLRQQALQRDGADEATWNAMSKSDQDALLRREYNLRYIGKVDAPVRDETAAMDRATGQEAGAVAAASTKAAPGEFVDNENAQKVAEERRQEAAKDGGPFIDDAVLKQQSDTDAFAAVTPSPASIERQFDNRDTPDAMTEGKSDIHPSVAEAIEKRNMQPGDPNPGGPVFARDAIKPRVATGVMDQAFNPNERRTLTEAEMDDLRERGELPEPPPATADMSFEDRLSRVERSLGIV